MANTLTNVTQAMLEDEVLAPLRLDRNPINAFSYGVEDKVKAVGDTVKVNILSKKTAKTYAGTFATGDGNTTTSTDVTLAAPEMSDFYVNPLLEGIPTTERFMAEAKDAAKAVVDKVVADCLGLFLAANIGDTAADKNVVTAANYDTDDQADLWALLAAKGVAGQRSALHNISYASSLMKDSALTDRSASGSDLITSGELPPVLGARQFYTDLFPSAITAQNTGVIYTGTETIAIGFADPMEVISGLENAAGVRVFKLVDEATGIPLIYRQWVDSNTGIYHGAVFAMYGLSFLRDTAVRIVSA